MKERLLTFEEFVRADAPPQLNYGNFHVHFAMTGIGPEIYRQKPYYQRFMREQPRMDAVLTEKITNRPKYVSTAESLKPFEREMYDAYVIMHGYGASNRELFA